MASGRNPMICGICNNWYDTPKRLPCHTFCSRCIRGSLVEGAAQIQCPICRLTHPLPEAGVDALPSDAAIEILVRQEREKQTTCSECQQAADVSKCPHCSQSVCSDCKTLHLKKLKGLQVILGKLDKIERKTPTPEVTQQLLARRQQWEGVQENALHVSAQIDDDINAQIGRLEAKRARLKVLPDQHQQAALAQLAFIDNVGAATQFRAEAAELLAGEVRLEDLDLLLEQCVKLTGQLADLDGAFFSQIVPSPLTYWRDQQQLTQDIDNYGEVGQIPEYRLENRLDGTEAEKRFTGLWDVAVHPDTGDLYTASGEHVIVYRPDGTYVRKFAAVHEKPFITVSQTGLVIVSSQGDHNVTVYASRGQKVTSFGSQGQNNGRFNSPTGVCTDDQDNVYIADPNNSRVQVHRQDGAYVRTMKREGMNRPIFVALDADKRLYVSDYGANTVTVFGENGDWLRTITGDGDVKLSGPYGLAIDGHGRMYVSNKDDKRVDVFSPAGRHIQSVADPEVGFEWACGLTVTPQGALVVADNNRKEIFIFSPQWFSLI